MYSISLFISQLYQLFIFPEDTINVIPIEGIYRVKSRLSLLCINIRMNLSKSLYIVELEACNYGR